MGVWNFIDKNVFKGYLPGGSAAELTGHTAILHGIPHTFNGKDWVPSKEYNATNRDTAVELMQKRREESTKPKPKDYGSGLSMPGVDEFHEELTSDFNHVPAMSLKVMNPSSTPKAAVEVMTKYNSPENQNIFGKKKPVSIPYNSEEYGAGTLYINSSTGGEVKFNPIELNEPADKRLEAQAQLYTGVQTALTLAGGLRIRGGGQPPKVQTTFRGDPLNKFPHNQRSLMSTDVTPRTSVRTTSKPTVTPKTTAGSLKHQSSSHDIGYDAGWRAINNLSKDSPYTTSGLKDAAIDLQMHWKDASTIDLGEIDPNYTKGLIPFNTLPPERQRQIRQQYNVQQHMADRAIIYSLEKYYEIMASGPHNITKSGILYPSPEFKRHIEIIKDFLGEPPERHHAQLKVADAMARLRLKELGNEQDLRIYDSVFDIMGMPGGGVMVGKQKELILLDRPYHSGHHKGLREAGLEPTGRPSEKLKKLFSTMNATEVVQYMIQLRLDTVPFNKKARAHAYMLLKEVQ